MVRKYVRLSDYSSRRLLLSVALGWTLLPITHAGAQSPPASVSAAPKVKAAAPKPIESSGKPLFTVPEDGLGDNKWLSGATRVVREITVKRPTEDLVICVAGCVETQARVVFAQPTEYVPPKPADPASDAAGMSRAAKPSAAIEADPAVSTPVSDSAPKPEFKPSMAEPAPADGATDSQPASKDTAPPSEGDAATKSPSGDGAPASDAK